MRQKRKPAPNMTAARRHVQAAARHLAAAAASIEAVERAEQLWRDTLRANPDEAARIERVIERTTARLRRVHNRRAAAGRKTRAAR